LGPNAESGCVCPGNKPDSDTKLGFACDGNDLDPQPESRCTGGRNGSDSSSELRCTVNGNESDPSLEARCTGCENESDSSKDTLPTSIDDNGMANVHNSNTSSSEGCDKPIEDDSDEYWEAALCERCLFVQDKLTEWLVLRTLYNH
jgi:hypothetical protein